MCSLSGGNGGRGEIAGDALQTQFSPRLSETLASTYHFLRSDFVQLLGWHEGF